MLSNIQGVRIGVRIGEQQSSKIAVDLHTDASPLSSLAKPLLLRALSDKGGLIEDFQSWTVRDPGERDFAFRDALGQRSTAADERRRITSFC